MSQLRGLFAALAMLVVAAFAHAGQAGVCVTPPLDDTVGLNDGCSVPGLATWVFPDVGIFKSTFTPACNNHDHCYSALGATASACNDKFLGDLRSACNSNFTVLSGPVYQACMDTAAQYHSAVVAYSVAVNPMGAIQEKSEARSQNVLGPWIASDTCATTPDLSGAYDSSLITQVNGAFQSYAHRLPTIYEFMATVNDGNLVDDRAGWNNRVIQHAIGAAAVTLPSVGLNWSAVYQVYTVSPVTPGATYSWTGLEGLRSSSPTSAVAWANGAPYNTVVTVGAVLRASANGVRNQAIVPEHLITVRGTCGPSAGNPCE
jgi:hypothetical protein